MALIRGGKLKKKPSGKPIEPDANFRPTEEEDWFGVSRIKEGI